MPKLKNAKAAPWPADKIERIRFSRCQNPAKRDGREAPSGPVSKNMNFVFEKDCLASGLRSAVPGDPE
jgi:hypothetical protein